MVAANLLCAAVLTVSAMPAIATIQISYSTEDLPDVVPGEDLWRYTYTVNGQEFDQSYGFNVYYPWENFAAATLVAAPQLGWAPVDVIGPNLEFELPGLLSAQAAQNLVAQPWVFTVDVVWLSTGAGVPGSQPYELFDPDFNRLEPPGVQQTVAQAIPEPQTNLLMLAGFVLLVAMAVRRESLRSRACRA